MEVGRIVVSDEDQKDRSQWRFGGSLGVIRWSGKTPTSVDGLKKVRASAGGPTVVLQNSDVGQWSGKTPMWNGGQMKLWRREVIRWKSGKAVVRLKSGVRQWSGRTPASGVGLL
ncbi:hypothetical protein MA16_Dca010576 [Dendrobium catenatum]|uniref:Uncharacterized protein n=1 Tax=Dendrobium catenatum TaxID=906689 RepID=A0A2I0VZJ5_9ASPA|nr:hypothetical protein MA16_Dca010576 [Dendrobium catenatum]